VGSDGSGYRMNNYSAGELGTPLDTGPARPYVNLSTVRGEILTSALEGLDHGYRYLTYTQASLFIPSYRPDRLTRHHQNHLITEIGSVGREFIEPARPKLRVLLQEGAIFMS
jgi:hypothetical protein